MGKEYGGYLPLELSKGRPYYTGEDVIALNAGRYAITYAIEDAGWKKIYLPVQQLKIHASHHPHPFLPVSVFLTVPQNLHLLLTSHPDRLFSSVFAGHWR